MAPDLLLFSSTSVHGYPPLGHAMEVMAEIVGGAKALHFAPFAIVEHDLYVTRVQEILAPIGISVVGLHAVPDPRRPSRRPRCCSSAAATASAC